MGDVVDGGANFGRQFIYLCITSHTSGTNQAIDLFLSNNWLQLASATNLDDGHLLRYRGSWQPNTEYSGDPIIAGEGGDFDDETTKIPERLNILLDPAMPEVYSGSTEDAHELGIGLTLLEPIVYNGDATESTDGKSEIDRKVETALRCKMYAGGELAELGPLDAGHPYMKDHDGDPMPNHCTAHLRTVSDGRRVYFDTDPEAEPPLKDDPTWAVFVVRETGRIQTDLAGRRFDVNGALIVDVRTPVKGISSTLPDKNPAMVAAEALQKLYNSGTVVGDGVRLYMTGSRINTIGPDGKWYMVRVEAPFRYYETR